jgi:cell cycle protein kinase DBF2
MAERQDFQLPIPPPPLHTRSSNMDRPATPSQERFISPQQTPQGSPSKSHAPPGAFDLPHVFENAMKLLPTIASPSKSKFQTPTSPIKAPLHGDDVDYSTQDLTTLGPGSPTRNSNKENTPSNTRPGVQKETSYITHAAQSRQEPYRTRGEADQSQRYYNGPQRLSPEELEKARKPSAKRLANVTQLCEYFLSQ